MFARLRSEPERGVWLVAAALAAAWWIIYMTTVSPTVNFIDSGELITALHEPGVAHPPGYPLYTLLGYVASRLPFGDVAWRVNSMSALWGALAVGGYVLLIFRMALFVQPAVVERPLAQRQPRRKTQHSHAEQVRAPSGDEPTTFAREWLYIAGAAAGASLLAASSSFWSRTAQAKMYALHFFLLAVLFLLALECRRAYDRHDTGRLNRLLLVLAAAFGLSLTNHLMTIIAAIPLALLLLVGERPGDRLNAIVRRLHFAVPAFVLPLLLYLYMPFRAAQSPIMNWGSTDSWGDFWRHVTGWQFRSYLTGDIAGNIQHNIGLLSGYAMEQWNLLTVIVYVAVIVGAVLLARARMTLFICTFAFVFLTTVFDLVYGISEIEPYAVPVYAVCCVWAGLIPAAWTASRGRLTSRGATRQRAEVSVRPPWWAAGVIAILALASAILVYPRQNYSSNRLAEQFALNVFSELPQKSIVLTDYWDFYAPTYYLQLLKDVRPDIVLINKSALRYPWYTEQLELRYPWLIEKSRDIIDRFAPEQRRWVNGEPFDGQAINAGYLDLLTSFVVRNYPEYTPYVIWQQDCPPGAQCEENQIAQEWIRQPVGLTYRLWPPGTTTQAMPPEPGYDLKGIISNPVAFDTFARINSEMYRPAFLRLADLYGRSGNAAAAARMGARASELAVALEGR